MFLCRVQDWTCSCIASKKQKLYGNTYFMEKSFLPSTPGCVRFLLSCIGEWEIKELWYKVLEKV